MCGKLHLGNNPKVIDNFMILLGHGNYMNLAFISKNGDTAIQGYVTGIITYLSFDWLKKKERR